MRKLFSHSAHWTFRYRVRVEYTADTRLPIQPLLDSVVPRSRTEKQNHVIVGSLGLQRNAKRTDSIFRRLRRTRSHHFEIRHLHKEVLRWRVDIQISHRHAMGISLHVASTPEVLPTTNKNGWRNGGEDARGEKLSNSIERHFQDQGRDEYPLGDRP